MDPAQTAALLNGLGVAGPLVGFLIWSLRENTKERQEITKNFLTALQTTITTATAHQNQLSQLVTEVIASLRALERRSSEEHAQALATQELIRERLHALAEEMTKWNAKQYMREREDQKRGGKRE